MGVAEALYFVDACLGSYIPEFDHPVVTNAAKLGVLNRIEGDLLDPSRMSLELCREADIRFVGVP